MIEEITRLATAHGLHLVPGSLEINEAGLDYRVAFARSEEGQDWVLRVPRRPDVSDKIEGEARVLALLRDVLPVQLPDWQVCSRQLVAYPLLPGRPGLTLDDAGQPVWHFDPTSAAYARSLGELLARLHEVDVERVRAAGIEVRSSAELKGEWRSHIARVTAEFDVSPALRQRWQAWLEDDGLWPEETTLTHGELYPAHALIDDTDRIVSVLDWTTARVADPAVDFVPQQMVAGPSFELTIESYREAGGRALPRLAERCAELTAASPVLYGVFALQSGRPEHRAAAAEQLNPE